MVLHSPPWNTPQAHRTGRGAHWSLLGGRSSWEEVSTGGNTPSARSPPAPPPDLKRRRQPRTQRICTDNGSRYNAAKTPDTSARSFFNAYDPLGR